MRKIFRKTSACSKVILYAFPVVIIAPRISNSTNHIFNGRPTIKLSVTSIDCCSNLSDSSSYALSRLITYSGNGEQVYESQYESRTQVLMGIHTLHYMIYLPL